MRVIGYTYEADAHCLECTKSRFLRHCHDAKCIECDEHYLAYELKDCEGNTIHPIFSTDEGPLDEDGNELDQNCGDCLAVIERGISSDRGGGRSRPWRSPAEHDEAMRRLAAKYAEQDRTAPYDMMAHVLADPPLEHVTGCPICHPGPHTKPSSPFPRRKEAA